MSLSNSDQNTRRFEWLSLGTDDLSASPECASFLGSPVAGSSLKDGLPETLVQLAFAFYLVADGPLRYVGYQFTSLYLAMETLHCG
ncbi:hypothetical protein [Synechococcus sp. CCY 9618]|uniref:hypothetical protein n=1 Tax=Synechococcus sp. CCY 9618 TaxID=2815602 RepID=UPI001C2151C9|nr:hypothetical protein [Synechococcus sp. CCY 9618]